MQFAPYTKRLQRYLVSNQLCSDTLYKSHVSKGKPMRLALLLFITVLMSACSVSVEKTKNQREAAEVKKITKDFTDLVVLAEQKQTPASSAPNSAKQSAVNTKNAYLEQEARLMRGVPKKVIASYQQALVLMSQQKWLAANALFDEVINKAPALSGSYLNKALISTQLSTQLTGVKKAEQLKTSELLLDKTISVNPLNPYGHYFKGEMLQKKGQFEQAQQHFSTALSIWPDYTQAQLSMAILLELYRGQLLEAHSYYSAYLQQQPSDKQVQGWQAALAIKIKRAGLTLPAPQGN